MGSSSLISAVCDVHCGANQRQDDDDDVFSFEVLHPVDVTKETSLSPQQGK